jgi:hypothetical protein
MLPTTAPAMAPVALTRLSSTSMATGHTAQPVARVWVLRIRVRVRGDVLEARYIEVG